MYVYIQMCRFVIQAVNFRLIPADFSIRPVSKRYQATIRPVSDLNQTGITPESNRYQTNMRPISHQHQTGSDQNQSNIISVSDRYQTDPEQNHTSIRSVSDWLIPTLPMWDWWWTECTDSYFEVLFSMQSRRYLFKHTN
jgi:hypothetical protein